MLLIYAGQSSFPLKYYLRSPNQVMPLLTGIERCTHLTCRHGFCGKTPLGSRCYCVPGFEGEDCTKPGNQKVRLLVSSFELRSARQFVVHFAIGLQLFQLNWTVRAWFALLLMCQRLHAKANCINNRVASVLTCFLPELVETYRYVYRFFSI